MYGFVCYTEENKGTAHSHFSGREVQHMPQNVLLDEGGYISVHTRIKDMCKEARNRMGLTNQDISNMISQRFGFEDFSVNTVNNFFSERSKATTIYTTGYICAVLSISIDAAFGIESESLSEKDNEFIRRLSELNVELRFKDQEIRNLEDRLREKDERLEQAHSALDHYRTEASLNRSKVQPWVFVTTVVLLICTILFLVIYLWTYDIGNPDFGIFSKTVSGIADHPLSLKHVSLVFSHRI